MNNILPGSRSAEPYEAELPRQLVVSRSQPAVDVDLALATGASTSIAQHGELLQGQLQDRDHRYRRFLVSLPCDRFYSKVTFVPVHDAALTVEPAHKTKVRKVVALSLQRFGLSHVGGSITVQSNIAEGKGCGSSTADCVAGALAVADAVGQGLSEDQVAELVVAAEIASDNFMFSRPVLFAHREGVVLEDLGGRLPRLEILGVDTDANGAVHTLSYPPAVYNWSHIQRFRMLVAGMRRAIDCTDLPLLGRVATASAIINQQFLPKPMFPELLRLANCVNALGVSVAHSGTVLSILFDPLCPRLEFQIEQAHRELDSLGITEVLRFQT